MAATAPSPDYRFGRFELRPAAQQLLVGGEPVALSPRAFELLVVLVERAGQLVPKGELLDRVWPGVVVEENNLQVQVSALRKILGAEAIATVSGRGYRFTLRPDAMAAQATGVATVAAPPTQPEVPSIVVLPFVNISDDAANEYFADGLSEELLNVLSKIRGLRVASRTSAFSFKGTKADIPAVARKLNVASVLEGSVRKAGTRVRVAVQLVNAATDSQQWSQTYDRELQDIFAVQDDIAHAVVREMRPALLGDRARATDAAELTAEVQAAVQGRSRNAEAYQLYLEGTFFLNRYNNQDTTKAIGCFRRALELDPDYAAAWASLSFGYLRQEVNAWAPISAGAARAREAAQRALALGPDVAASHWALGAILLWHDWDWRGAEAALRRALRLAPDDAQLLILAATLMQNLGQWEEARALVGRALALDPLNVEAYANAGLQHLYTQRLAEAERTFGKALELSPHERARLHYLLGRVYLAQGRLDEAWREVEQESHDTFRLLGTVLVQHARGHRTESESTLRELTRKYA
ncbi:MAG: winged helix-turn-helix domain-containing protein, partial [Aquincola sp.]|nr:winged helix-turn-helix domain-containing protein [Aquincola sp.]MDH5329461.1 winged helix-turn-helix domain-containing protein [Aquincola sp.]